MTAHWHVKFHDWRETRLSDGTIEIKSVGIPVFSAVLPLYTDEAEACAAARRVEKYYEGSHRRPVGIVALVKNCNDAACPGFADLEKRKQREAYTQKQHDEAHAAKAKRDAEDEQAWRSRTREKVR